MADFNTQGLNKQWSSAPVWNSDSTDAFAGIQSGWSQSLGGGNTQQYGMNGENLGITGDKSTWDHLKPLLAIAGMAVGGGMLAGGAGEGSALSQGFLDGGGSGMVAEGNAGGGMWGAGTSYTADAAANMSANEYAAFAARGGAQPSWWESALGALGGGATDSLPSWLRPAMSIGSGLYGMYQANQMKNTAQDAINGSSPWTTSGGTAMAGDALKQAISGDLSNDPGYKLAELSAARTSAQQPGGFAAQAAANAAAKYRLDSIQALGGAAGVGFNPAQGYSTGLQGMQAGGNAMSSALGSIGFGLTDKGVPPWLQSFLVKNGMGG